ncbi:MAG: DUF4810 domain-containing protein [Candidatus Azobacteroides sp.]|nr:DUF4810 domain-containing protein [Candidatus Azobacteroides sp.]
MKKLFAFGLFCLLLTGCVSTTKPLYSWSNYQDQTYNYIKNETPESLGKLMKTYQIMIDKQTGSRKTIPPGICADYGFLLYKQGKKEEGISFLKKEIALYPESAVFISSIIKNLEK